MPQFDLGTFFSQLFWLNIIFYTFYIMLFQKYIPRLTRIFKIRRKKLAFAQKNLFQSEHSQTIGTFETFLNQFVENSRVVSKKNVQSGFSWVSHSLEKIHCDFFKQVHTHFLHLNGSIRGYHVLFKMQLNSKKSIV